MKNSYLENKYCEYWIDEHGIIHEIFKSNFDVLNLEIAKIITKDRLVVSKDTMRPLYVELGDAVKLDWDASKYLSSGIAMNKLSACGILVRDDIERYGASLYTKFFRPKIPTKYFTDKDKALFWLLNHRIDSLN